MTHSRLTQLERAVEDIRFEDYKVKEDLDKIKRELIDKTPDHFSKKDFLRAFIGALFLGFSVLFSSNLFNFAKNVPERHFYIIILFTLIVLTAEIYFIGYSRVEDKRNRPFVQFWIKRLLAFYTVALFVSFLLAYIFGLMYLAESQTVFWNIVLLLSVPCAIGACFADLVKKY